MADQLMLGPVHHVALRITNLELTIAFYQEVLGFQTVVALPDVTILSNGTLILGIRGRDPAQPADRFDEFRVGLDHLSFGVESRADLDRAIQVFDERGIPHGDVEDLGAAFGIYVLAFRDPDNIQLELTAPYR